MGLNIKRVFIERGVRVKDVAEKMGITSVGLSQHINGKPSIKVLENIAEAIGCDLIDFFEPDKPEQPIYKTKFICPHCGKEYEIRVMDCSKEEKKKK